MWGEKQSFSRAILHVDGDSFFVSCEVALDPSLKGKPVITGKERGIASAMSYEAKRRGISRGMSLWEIKKICPEVIILPSDYETYGLFSMRMYEIVRRYTPEVEEYSIDECFADITGLRQLHRASYEAIAQKIKKNLQNELGMTFSLGLAPTKVIAKVASKWNKPDGFVVICSKDISSYLAKLPVGEVWGIGPNTSARLQKYGIKTAADFASRNESWVRENLSKPYQEIWRELHGESIYKVNSGDKDDYKSISKTRTFTPPSSEKSFVFSQLSKNIENACIKARRYNLLTRHLFFFLKTQDFRFKGLEIELISPLSSPFRIIELVRNQFEKIFKSEELYRATGIVLGSLRRNNKLQQDLFGETVKIASTQKIFESIDTLDKKYGKHTVFLVSSLRAMREARHEGVRGSIVRRKNNLFKGETKRMRLSIPMLGEVK